MADDDIIRGGLGLVTYKTKKKKNKPNPQQEPLAYGARLTYITTEFIYTKVNLSAYRIFPSKMNKNLNDKINCCFAHKMKTHLTSAQFQP